MSAPVWQYHEPDHPGADFDALAEIYDRNMQKFRDVHGEIIEILDFLVLRPDQCILEIGTGTGEFALAAARRCRKVYAVDLSAGMLRYAEKKAQARGVANIEFLPGGFLTYRHNGAPFDGIVSQIALAPSARLLETDRFAAHGRDAGRGWQALPAGCGILL